jgi:hypothetical protein
MAAQPDAVVPATGDAHAQARDQGAMSGSENGGGSDERAARRREGPRLTERARDEREERARRVAAEMRENLLKRKRQQRALRDREPDR